MEGFPTYSKRELGMYGEQLACEFLIEKGYRILERNWRCRLGEIDIIAQTGKYTVFVEVKTRTSSRYGLAVEAVDRHKQSKLRRLAQSYIAMRSLKNPHIRFDVICVKHGHTPRSVDIQHFEYAF
jgi:putative endonuclease